VSQRIVQNITSRLAQTQMMISSVETHELLEAEIKELSPNALSKISPQDWHCKQEMSISVTLYHPVDQKLLRNF